MAVKRKIEEEDEKEEDLGWSAVLLLAGELLQRPGAECVPHLMCPSD
jgi:hypothetical protein